MVGRRDQKIQMSKTNCRWFWSIEFLEGQQAKYKYLFHTALFTLLETFLCISNICYTTCLYFWRNVQRNIFQNDGDSRKVFKIMATRKLWTVSMQIFLKLVIFQWLPLSKYLECEEKQIIWSNLLLNKQFLSNLVGIGVGNTARRSQDSSRWEISGSFKSSPLLWVG